VQIYVVLNFLSQEGFVETAEVLRAEAASRVALSDAVRNVLRQLAFEIL
jgi:DNA-binding PadR family transcriptional regulator